MKYLLATGACVVIVLLYAAIGASLGWVRGGGFLPMMLLLGAISATWKGITDRA